LLEDPQLKFRQVGLQQPSIAGLGFSSHIGYYTLVIALRTTGGQETVGADDEFIDRITDIGQSSWGELLNLFWG
jgi:hypothetical protein